MPRRQRLLIPGVPVAPGPRCGAIPCRNCLSPAFCARRNPRSSVSRVGTPFPCWVRALGGGPSSPSHPGDTPRRCPAALETVTTVRREQERDGGVALAAWRMLAPPPPASLASGAGLGVSVLQQGDVRPRSPAEQGLRAPRALAAGADPGPGAMLTGSEEERSSALAWLRGPGASVSTASGRRGRDG